jgi:hypothetical protein
MKVLKFMAVSSVLLLSNLCANEDAVTKIDQESIIQEVQTSNLDFSELRKKAPMAVSNLADCIYGAENSSVAELALDRVKRKKRRKKPVQFPNSEALTYINGFLCHVGNYTRSSIVTVMDGPDYGLQTTVDYSGIVLSVNYECIVEHTPDGVTFKHEYPDCQIITGSEQIIKFY